MRRLHYSAAFRQEGVSPGRRALFALSDDIARLLIFILSLRHYCRHFRRRQPPTFHCRCHCHDYAATLPPPPLRQAAAIELIFSLMPPFISRHTLRQPDFRRQPAAFANSCITPLLDYYFQPAPYATAIID
jgi:hypothetical protein